LVHEELRRKKYYFKRAAELFQKIDQDCSGDISEEEILKFANDPQTVAVASSLELDVADIMQFYGMLSCRGKYAVDVDTFVCGCMKLKGTARSMDLQALMASDKRASRVLEDLVATSNRTFALIQQFLPTDHRAAMLSQSANLSERDVSLLSVAAVDREYL